MGTSHEFTRYDYDWNQPLNHREREIALSDIQGLSWPLPETPAYADATLTNIIPVPDQDAGVSPFDVYVAPQLTTNQHLIALKGMQKRVMVLMQEQRGRIKDQQSHIKRLEIDHVTEIYTRNAWEERAIKLLKENPGRYGVKLFDLDFFKRVNDTYGHPEGDKTLKGAAAAGKRGLHTDPDSPADIIDESILFGRFGGEELIALVPIGAEVESAEKFVIDIANRCIRNTNTIILPARDKRGRFTVSYPQGLSVGISIFSYDAGAEDAVSPEEQLRLAVKQADAALYQAKEGGRNQAVLYKQGEPLIPSREGRRKAASKTTA